MSPIRSASNHTRLIPQPRSDAARRRWFAISVIALRLLLLGPDIPRVQNLQPCCNRLILYKHSFLVSNGSAYTDSIFVRIQSCKITWGKDPDFTISARVHTPDLDGAAIPWCRERPFCFL